MCLGIDVDAPDDARDTADLRIRNVEYHVDPVFFGKAVEPFCDLYKTIAVQIAFGAELKERLGYPVTFIHHFTSSRSSASFPVMRSPHSGANEELPTS